MLRSVPGLGVATTLLVAALGAVSCVAAPALASSPPAGEPSPTAVASPSPAASPETSAGGIPFRFQAYPFELRDLSLTERPFSGGAICRREDRGIHDAQGVRMRISRGKMYDFPRGQASYGLSNLHAYRLTNDTFYLDRALAQANRLLSYRDEAGGAWYYPNYPSRYRHGQAGEPIMAPYYSALPQGRILLFFSRLAEMTGLDKWREAADRTFAAFLRPGPRSGPFILNIDRNGYYWLQEWPWPNLVPDCTLNGHISSLFGLFEYYTLTRDGRARQLFRGAVTTVRHYLPKFRRDGWISCYCLAHRGANATYHNMHVGQLLGLYRMTGALVFARAADAFSNDYPKPEVRGTLRVEPGIYNAVKVDSVGRVVARRTVRVRGVASWRTTLRRRLYRRSPIYLRAGSGIAAGWWLPERSGKVYLKGTAAARTYNPARTLALAAGVSCAALKFDERSNVAERVRVKAGAGLRLTVARRAVINGVDRVRVSGGGELDGFWLKLRKGLRLF